MTTHKIITGDSRNLAVVPAASVQLIVTSPPYPMIEMWDDLFDKQDPTIHSSLAAGDGMSAYKKMHAVLNDVWSECDRVLVDNGFICINIGDATRTIGNNFQLYPNHIQVISFFQDLGYSVLPDIHWRKQSNSPNKFMGSGMYPAGAYVTYEHEYILIFRKGGKRVFSGKAKQMRQKSAYFWEERNIWFSDLWNIKGTSQIITASDIGRNRNASYPFEIPYRLVNMYSAEGDTVLDPFSGLGTTSLACMASKRNSIGIEIDPTIATLSLKNMAITPQKLNEVVRSRLANHVAFIESLPLEQREKCYENKLHGFKVKTKQETAIKLDQIEEVVTADNIVTCTYE
ncbi:MAG: site-specific DNA-methyltransferase [Clostridiales bacterium]|nr:site-specific DNA-methyltransferase [Clostridiales bacterium]